MNDDARQDHNGSTLPMVISLRGDEKEFTLTAEDVMAALDIKRSRLTQISGRELRVGRRRVDRYLKPFYRPADVHAYQELTRAALTRQRSAAAVSSVADDIETRHKNLLQETTTQLRTALTDTSRTLQKNLRDLLISSHTKTRQLTTASNLLQKNKILRGIETLARHGYKLLAAFEQQSTALHDRAVQQIQELLHTQHTHTLQTIRDNTSSQRDTLAASDAAHTAQLLTLQQSSEDIARQLRDLNTRQKHQLHALHRLVTTQLRTLEHTTTRELQALHRTTSPVRVWSSTPP